MRKPPPVKLPRPKKVDPYVREVRKRTKKLMQEKSKDLTPPRDLT